MNSERQLTASTSGRHGLIDHDNIRKTQSERLILVASRLTCKQVGSGWSVGFVVWSTGARPKASGLALSPRLCIGQTA